MPRILALLFNVIAIFLTIFTLIGCYNQSNLSTFLVSYKFETSSPFYSVIKNSFASSTSSSKVSLKGLENIEIKSGYMGVCILNIPKTYNGNISSICYPRKNLFNTSLYSDLSIELFNLPSSSNTSSTSTETQSDVPIKLNILQLGQLTSVDIIHPYILMATIVLTSVMFLLVFYIIVPKLPVKYYVNRILLIWSSTLVLLSGIGTMWTHVGINSSSELVPAASMGIISSDRGEKAATMSWFAFGLLILECLILWFLYFRDRKKLSDEIDKVKTKSSYENNSRYLSDSSTLNSKV